MSESGVESLPPTKNRDDLRRWKLENLAAWRSRLARPAAKPDGGMAMIESGDHYVYVLKEEGNLTLWMMPRQASDSGIVQSELTLAQPEALVDPYTQAATLGLLWRPAPRRIYTTGLGGGCLPMVLHHHFPAATIDCTEIDAGVIAAAQQYFGFQEDETLRVYLADGREWLAQTAGDGPYDLMILDVFLDEGQVPYPLATREFMTLCRERLHPQGVLALNLLYLDPYNADRIRTVAAVFEHLYLCPLGRDNDVLFASAAPLPDPAAVRASAPALKTEHGFAFPFARHALRLEPLVEESFPGWSTAQVLYDAARPAGYDASRPAPLPEDDEDDRNGEGRT